MSCKIDYIENSGFSESTKKELTDGHIKIANEIYNYRWDNKGNYERVFMYNPVNGLLTVGAYKNSEVYRKAEILINTINKKYGDDIVELLPVENYDSLLKVSIDVRKSSLLTLGEKVNWDDIKNESNYMYMLSQFGNSAITQLNDEFVDPVLEHDDMFKGIVNNISELLDQYLSTTHDDRFDMNSRIDMVQLRNVLKDPSKVAVIQGISKYITLSGHSVNSLTKRVMTIKNELSNLSENSVKRKNQLARIADFVKHSSYYYHLFAPLEDISAKLDQMGVFENSIDNYYKDSLEMNLESFLKENFGNFLNEQDIKSILDSTPIEINNPSNLFVKIKEMYKRRVNEKSNGALIVTEDQLNSWLTDFQNVLTSSEKPERSLINQLNRNVRSYRIFQNEIKDLHYNVMGEILYPIMESAFDGKSDEFLERAKDKKWLSKNKEDFKTLLQFGDKEIKILPNWFSANIDVKDNLARTISLYFKELQIFIDQENKKDVYGVQNFLTKNKWWDRTDSAKKEIHKLMSSENLTINNFIPVDESYEGPSVSINILGRNLRFSARKTMNFLGEYDEIAFYNLKGAFNYLLPIITDEFTELLYNDPFALRFLQQSSDIYLKFLHDKIYTLEPNGEYSITAQFNDAIKDKKVRRILYTALQQGFYRNNIDYKSQEEKNSLFIENRIIDSSHNELDINSPEVVNFIKKNSKSKGYDVDSFMYLSTFDPDSLFSYGHKDDKTKRKFLVKFSDGEFGFVEVTSRGIPIPPSGKEISYFFTVRGELTKLAEKYHVSHTKDAAQWKALNRDKFTRDYFKGLMHLYNSGNIKLGYQSLKLREVPQVDKLDDRSTLNKLGQYKNKFTTKEGLSESFNDLIKSYTVEEDSEPLINSNGEYIDTDGNVLPPGSTPVYVSKSRVNVDGTTFRQIPIRFKQPIPNLENVETDYYRSVLLFKTMANQYGTLHQHESEVLLLKTLLFGDEKLSIDPRKMKIVDKKGNPVLTKGFREKFFADSNGVTNVIDKLINDTFYNENIKDFGLLGTSLSAKAVVNTMAGMTGFMALAWNITGMAPNYIISAINERSVAEGNQFWNKKHFRQAMAEYWRNVMDGSFFADFKKGFVNEKSILTQLVIDLDAIQGEFLNPQGIIDTKNVGEKFFEQRTYWTMNCVEHANQTQSMIMLMKGYTLPSGRSLWDAIQEENKDWKRGDQLKYPSEFDDNLKTKFKLRLQGVNRMVHGNYARQDRNMAQRTMLGTIMMMFRKWIYDGIRARFDDEDYSYDIQDEVQGYFNSYLSGINEEFLKIKNEQGWLTALIKRGWKDIPLMFVKTTLGAVDATTQTLTTKRLLSSSSSKLKNFVYGKNAGERQLNAALRSTYELGLMMQFVIIAGVLEGLSRDLDDDDANKKVLQYFELMSRRVGNDLGFFLSPFSFAEGELIPGLTTLDQFFRLTKDPFVAYRSIDTTAGLFVQLTDFSFIDKEGNYDFNWGGNDVYEKSGKGYEKGDYKIVRKLQKSIFAPYYQIIKLLNPQQSLDYMNLQFKYSK